MEPTNENTPQSNMTPKQQIAEHLKAAGSIVVTTNKKPTLDEITTVIGFTHMLQSMGKHATGVISTTLPKAVEFLNPRNLVEADTKRLQDFVVSLHKDKADKLRYKVDGDYVKIFITPYKTVISEKDFSFTAGDYNIDTVVAIGVMQRNEIDDAMLVSARILGDSKLITINKGDSASTIGAMNWNEPQAVSVAEMIISISESLGSGLIKSESSQALLTSLVSATDQFGNQLTTPKIMTMAAQLMAAGADQQLIVKHLKDANHLKVIEDASKNEIKEQLESKAEPKQEKKAPETKENKNEPSKQPEQPKEEKTVSEIVRDENSNQPTKPEKTEQQPTNTEPNESTEEQPHVNTHPELPTLKSVLENKSQQEKLEEQPKQEKVNDQLLDAREAVKQAEDSQAPENPEPTQSLNAQNVESGNDSDITIDHNGDVVLPQ